ncbi:unnamed protein product [Spirodela intermedia]|uniref:BHLH domain-containing protein n=1 Tax=Spirodela intermedia TaxID=51605 RepID=A0A7I8JCJ1_SPIIN|nr:unnamed protein product [Spirodela intermedia]CAA6667445.1 unnamed protein product [Spirodela intermedia]
MELPSVPWQFDQGFDDPGFVDQCDQMPPLGEFISEEQMAAALGNDFGDSLSPESRTSYSALAPAERPSKFLKTGGWSSSDASRRRVLSFAAGEVKPEDEVMGFSVSVGERSNSGRRSPSRSKDHSIAERRRREKLSQRFIALSAMVPGLKKMDKASVLGDAVSYVKKLQERVRTLEDQAVMKTGRIGGPPQEVPAGGGRHRSSSDGNFESPATAGGLPEIDDRRLRAEGPGEDTLREEERRPAEGSGEMEKLQLSVLNASVIPFAGSSFLHHIMAQASLLYPLLLCLARERERVRRLKREPIWFLQIEEECSMTANELVKHLNSAYRQLISSKSGRSSVQPRTKDDGWEPPRRLVNPPSNLGPGDASFHLESPLLVLLREGDKG